MIQIESVHFDHLRPPEWRATYCLKPDLRTLRESVMTYGWTAPIVVQASTSYIIDGFHRWVLAQKNPLLKRDKGIVPVHFLEVDEIDAMVAHVRMNRGRGDLVPRFLSMLVRDILRSKKYSEDELKKLLGMGVDEFGLLVEGGLLNRVNLAEYEYSHAWVPIESNGSDSIVIERPPNPDS